MSKADKNLVKNGLASRDVEHFPELLDGEGHLKGASPADDVNMLDAAPGLKNEMKLGLTLVQLH